MSNESVSGKIRDAVVEFNVKVEERKDLAAVVKLIKNTEARNYLADVVNSIMIHYERTNLAAFVEFIANQEAMIHFLTTVFEFIVNPDARTLFTAKCEPQSEVQPGYHA